MVMKPEYFESLLGKKLIRDVKPGERVKKKYFKSE
jgi:sialic acid synthase SpsE